MANTNLRKHLTSNNSMLWPLCAMAGTELTAAKNLSKEITIIDNSVDKLATIISAKEHNNAVVIGEAGVGKTAHVKKFADMIAADKWQSLRGVKLVEINLDLLFKDCASYHDKGTRIRNLFEEAKDTGTVLFFDEGHRLCDDNNANSISNVIKPYITSGDVQVILATTIDEYRRYICKDRAMQRRFECVSVAEPTPSETLIILKHVIKKRYPKIAVEDSVLELLVSIACKYVHNVYDPDRSLSLLDYAVSYASKLETVVITEEIMYKAAEEKLDVPHGSIVGSLNERMQKLQVILREAFPGWEEACDELALALEPALTRQLRNAGPLVAVVLSGSDEDLLKNVAKEASSAMGYLESEIEYVGLSDGSCKYTDGSEDHPLIAPFHKNPHSALILSDFRDTADKQTLAYAEKIIKDGSIPYMRQRKIDFSRVPVFILTKSKEKKAFESIGFGDGNKGKSRKPKNAADTLKMLDVGELPLVSFGVPEKNRVDILIEKAFCGRLAENLKIIDCKCSVSLTQQATEYLKSLCSDAKAWEYLIKEAEKIVSYIIKGKTKGNVLADHMEDGWTFVCIDDKSHERGY